MITLLLTLIIVGVCLYLIETYIPMSPPVATILRVVVVIALILFVLRTFNVPVPSL